MKNHTSLNQASTFGQNQIDEKEELRFDALLAGSLHDIKNSIGILLGNLDHMLSDKQLANSGSDQNISQLKLNGEQVKLNLIQLLTIFRLKSDDQLVNIQEHNIQDFLEECIAPFEELFAFKGFALELHCDKESNWYFDRDLVNAVITNILNNTYYQAKSITRIEAHVGNKGMTLVIVDDGEGYPEAVLSRKHGAKGEIKFQSGSTGLGLYFSSLTARAHKNKGQSGYIQLDNQGINHGGRFTLFLP